MAEQKRLEKQINSIQTQLKSFPEGKLICTCNGNRYKWYLSDGHTLTYLPKKERLLAEQLATKKYLTCLLKDLQDEKTALDYYLHHHRNIKTSEELLIKTPEYKNLLSTLFTPESKELILWMNSAYEKNPKHPEQLLHHSVSGHLVRSKSEVFIDMTLFTNRIPFRYECALELGNSTIYPDFTIRHPHTGETYYWEHFGRMDDPVYSRNACSKLQLYISNGILPSIHLITTYETLAHPLSTETIDSIIKDYFL